MQNIKGPAGTVFEGFDFLLCLRNDCRLCEIHRNVKAQGCAIECAKACNAQPGHWIKSVPVPVRGGDMNIYRLRYWWRKICNAVGFCPCG
jgi:hypothetical protein